MNEVQLRLLNKTSPELAEINRLVAGDPESLRQIPLYARADCWQRLVRTKHKILGVYDGARFVGFVDFTLDLAAGVSTLAYWVVPAERGKGYGSALVGEGIRWVHHALPIGTFRAFVDIDNVRSRRALEANGFRQFAARGSLTHWELVVAESRWPERSGASSESVVA